MIRICFMVNGLRLGICFMVLFMIVNRLKLYLVFPLIFLCVNYVRKASRLMISVFKEDP